MDKEQARKASKAGATAAFISGGLTTAVVAIAMATNAKGPLGLWNDPAMFFDILLILGCGIGMLRYSRSAAIVVTVYFILSKVVVGLETGKFTGIGIALVFLYYFGRAIQGTFVYHRMLKEENPAYKSAPKWMSCLGGRSLRRDSRWTCFIFDGGLRRVDPKWGVPFNGGGGGL